MAAVEADSEDPEILWRASDFDENGDDAVDEDGAVEDDRVSSRNLGDKGSKGRDPTMAPRTVAA